MSRARAFYLKHEVRFLWLGLLAVVVVLAYDDAHDESVDKARTCESALQARAAQLIDAELLIIASGNADADDESRQQRVDRFRQLERNTWLAELPPICQGVYTLPDFIRAVDQHVADQLQRRDLAQQVAPFVSLLR